MRLLRRALFAAARRFVATEENDGGTAWRGCWWGRKQDSAAIGRGTLQRSNSHHSRSHRLLEMRRVGRPLRIVLDRSDAQPYVLFQAFPRLAPLQCPARLADHSSLKAPINSSHGRLCERFRIKHTSWDSKMFGRRPLELLAILRRSRPSSVVGQRLADETRTNKALRFSGRTIPARQRFSAPVCITECCLTRRLFFLCRWLRRRREQMIGQRSRLENTGIYTRNRSTIHQDSLVLRALLRDHAIPLDIGISRVLFLGALRVHAANAR